MGVWRAARGGGDRGDNAYFDAKFQCFGRLWIFSPRWVWTLLKNWCPPILDAETSNSELPWPNETVPGLCEEGKLARF